METFNLVLLLIYDSYINIAKQSIISFVIIAFSKKQICADEKFAFA